MIRALPHRNVRTDLAWNGLSFALMAGAGIVMNLLVLHQRGVAALGVFNQVYAVYLILSQLTSGGFHLSLQSYIARFSGRKDQTSMILESAFISGLLQALVVVLIAWPLAPLVGELLQSPEVSGALVIVLPGLVFFSLNKMMLAYLNGLREMKSFAILRALRFLLALSLLIFLLFSGASIEWVSASFAFAEIALFFPLFIHVLGFYRWQAFRRSRSWVPIHWRFAKQAFAANLIMDINARVDVLMIGYFMGDGAVGLYSFASTLAEGLRQVSEIFRYNFNPLLTRLRFDYPTAVFERVVRRSVPVFYKFLAPLAVVSMAGFPALVWIFDLEFDLLEASLIYGVLAAGVGLASGYLPLWMLFNQCGRADLQTRLFLWYFFTNLVLNMALIPAFGPLGAAIATSSALVIQVFIIKRMAARHLGVRI